MVYNLSLYMKKRVLNIFFFLFCAAVLAFSLRGLPGNPTPTELNTAVWKENGPLELSPERGRYALAYSLAENHAFSFSSDLARFVAPDVAYLNGKYVSLFAPSVSFIVIPGLMIGKYFGLAQVGSFAFVALFALLNVWLLRAIAIRLGAHPLAAAIAAMTFIFASPAFSYAVTLYQHHISTFLILAAIYLLIRYNSARSLAGIWLLTAFSITVDYPNLFMMLPIGVLGVIRTFPLKKELGRIIVKIPFLRIFAVGAVMLPLLYFFWFNTMSYGSPFHLSGTNERAIEVKADGTPLLESEVVKQRLKTEGKKKQQPSTNDQSLVSFFKTRNMINGLYTHFVSADRGIIMYTPVMLLGIVGFVLAVQRRMKYTGLLTAVLGFNVLLYSMWGDPYGGWAFGSRYLIPSYAIFSIFLSFALTRFRNHVLFLLLFFIAFNYSVAVNTLGAVTSGTNPPKVEAVALEQISHLPQPYTYMRNMSFLNSNISKSFVFQSFAKQYISAWNYYLIIILGILSVGAFLLFALNSFKEEYEV